ncbi:LapA family protein [Paraferrimonas sedimenticola]|uniref:Probable lipopolysaccharide assembly protein A n=1 Tax=Paraferrimonas sedimenticola TaxID=375674 RepID=A0AA37RWJ0_9GAMM|nr:lipopolysaccharide assembly protein LapA domain-containing protein [Paraferrimonas sedimenticola]GLP96615.1 putative lipopolysaccharide assembly protein A [Paraferrimonas sedimenticola]
MKTLLVTLVVALLFLVALAFGSQNEQMVTINYFLAQDEFRLPVVLSVVFFSGFVSCWLIAMVFVLRLKLSLRSANKRIKSLNAQSSESQPETVANAQSNA